MVGRGVALKRPCGAATLVAHSNKKGQDRPATSEESKSVVRVAARQSGVKGVQWRDRSMCWRVTWGRDRNTKEFSVRKYMKSSGKGYTEADADALRDAIAFRVSLIKDGVMKSRAASRQSAIRGVSWARGRWRVDIGVHGKHLFGGSFLPRDDTPEEVERARLAAVERRRQLELEHFQIQKNAAADLSEVQKKRTSGVARVVWVSCGLFWKVDTRVDGNRIQKRFQPKDLSNESIEAARLAAVQHLNDVTRHLGDSTETPN